MPGWAPRRKTNAWLFNTDSILFFLKYTQKQAAGSSCTQQSSGKLLGPRLPKPIYSFFFYFLLFSCFLSCTGAPKAFHLREQRADPEEQSCCCGTLQHLFQHVSFIFSSSPSPQIKHSQEVPEQPHPSSSHESVSAEGGNRLLEPSTCPAQPAWCLLPSSDLGRCCAASSSGSSRLCTDQPLTLTNVQLSPFSGSGIRCTTHTGWARQWHQGSSPAPSLLCPQAVFLSHF